MLRHGLFLILATLVFANPRASGADLSTGVFEKEVTQSLKLGYLLSLPAGYESDPKKKWPLVVFLHGAGERGEDLTKVEMNGPPKRVKEGPAFPFILVAPQCPADAWWTEQPVLELIDSLEESHRVDSSKIYLTGLSMGGYGTWHFATLGPGRFAAVAPVCGGGIPYKMRWIPHLPVWAFHGAKDPVVPLAESERLVEALQKAGNEEAKLTVYPEAGHDSWTETYQNPDFYEWLLSHSLKAAQ